MDSLSKEKSKDKGNVGSTGYTPYSRGHVSVLPFKLSLVFVLSITDTLSDIFVSLSKPVKIEQIEQSSFLGLQDFYTPLASSLVRR